MDNWRKWEKNNAASEIQCYRRILKIKWSDKVSNGEVLDRMSIGKKIWKTILRKRVRMMGHNLKIFKNGLT